MANNSENSTEPFWAQALLGAVGLILIAIVSSCAIVQQNDLAIRACGPRIAAQAAR